MAKIAVMKKNIEKLFPAAHQAIMEVFKEHETKPIDSEFQGYISSFGASVLQMGLLPTLAVFADEDSGSAQDREKLLVVLAKVLAHKSAGYALHSSIADQTDNLFEFSIHLNKNERVILQKHLLDASVAVKLCLRTFKLKKKNP
jgi:CRISPR-associated protein Cmr5